MPSKVELAKVRFAEAIAFLRDRLAISEAEWQVLLRGAEAAAGRASSDMTEAMQRDLLTAVADIMEDGGTAADFLDRYEDIAARYGWESEKGAGWRADLIFRVQTANARAAGRWDQVQRLKSMAPYVRYVTARDHRVRHTHRLWHDVVLHADHPFWQAHWPPNGFNCRCYVQSLNDRDLARYGFAVTPDTDPALTIPADPGWDSNAGIAWAALLGR